MRSDGASIEHESDYQTMRDPGLGQNSATHIGPQKVVRRRIDFPICSFAHGPALCAAFREQTELPSTEFYLLMKSLLRKLLHRMPRVKRLFKNLVSILRREPKITYGSISDKSIIALIKKEDPVILDIGCNDGSQTLWFLGLFKKHVYTALNLTPAPVKDILLKSRMKGQFYLIWQSRILMGLGIFM